mgnify:CR=1 FL=1
MARHLRRSLLLTLAVLMAGSAGAARADDAENSRIADKIVACINAKRDAAPDAELRCDHLTDVAAPAETGDASSAPAAEPPSPAADAAVDNLFQSLECLKEKGEDAQLACMERLKADKAKAESGSSDAAPELSADPACWSDSVSLADKRSRHCFTAEVKTGPGSDLATLDDLVGLRVTCCDGLTPRFSEAMLPDDAPEGLVKRWTALMPDRSIFMIDGYDSAAAAQQAASFASALGHGSKVLALVERYQKAAAAMGDHAPPARADIDLGTIATLEAGSLPIPGDRGKIKLYTRCFYMAVKRSYVLCNAYLPGTFAVATYLRRTKSVDDAVTSPPIQLLDALLAERIVQGNLPASPPP